MEKGITLHPEFGVNPGMALCFYCGEAKEVILFGNNRGKEAPRSAVYDLKPCDKCKEKYREYILLVECKDNKSEPTGPFIAVKRNAFEIIFNCEAPKGGVAKCEPEVIEKLSKMIGGSHAMLRSKC